MTFHILAPSSVHHHKKKLRHVLNTYAYNCLCHRRSHVVPIDSPRDSCTSQREDGPVDSFYIQYVTYLYIPTYTYIIYSLYNIGYIYLHSRIRKAPPSFYACVLIQKSSDPVHDVVPIDVLLGYCAEYLLVVGPADVHEVGMATQPLPDSICRRIHMGRHTETGLVILGLQGNPKVPQHLKPKWLRRELLLIEIRNAASSSAPLRSN
jgi:hypothetical protein